MAGGLSRCRCEGRIGQGSGVDHGQSEEQKIQLRPIFDELAGKGPGLWEACWRRLYAVDRGRSIRELTGLRMNWTEISQRLAGEAETIASMLLPNGKKKGAEWCVGSIDGEEGDSLKVRLNGNKAGVWRDFASDIGGDLLDLWA